MPGAVVELSELNGINGFRIDGATAKDASGRSVSSAGDVNGDGLDDLLIGSHFNASNGRTYGGSSYVVFGRSGGFAPTLELSALDGKNGFRLDAAARDSSGYSVSSAGDVNGDGFDDVIIGAHSAAPSGRNFAGSSYVVFGRAGGFAPALELSALDGTNGFRLDGAAAVDRSGIAVSSAGDVNGDGFDDLIIGARGADPSGRLDSGSSYLVFGRSGGFDPALELSALNGTNGFRIDGVQSRDYSGTSVSSAGDVNGDGLDDLIVGATHANPSGRPDAGSSYLVFGRSGGFDPVLKLSALDGSNGFRLDGAATLDRSGFSVSSAGDVNGDGFDDLIIGATGADPSGRPYAGSAYVVFGKSAGFAPRLELSALNGTNGFRLDGAAANDGFGRSVASAGDVNGDGFDDLIVGAFDADPSGRSGAGSSYVVFGRSGGFDPVLELSALDWRSGFRLDGAAPGDQSGFSVSSAGDVNGDGFDDLIVGARYADPSGRDLAGSSYVVFGGPSRLASAPTLSGDFALDVAQGGRVALTLDDLSASDAESGPDALVFTVTATTRGFVALDAAPGAPVAAFTQSDLAAGRVAFVHDGAANPTAGFTATVRDGDGETAGPQAVSVAVSPSPVAPFRVEAEDFTLGAGFAVKARNSASGGSSIEALGFKGEAVATYRFDGFSGLYDLALGHFDESDGTARMRLLVNGEEIDAWDWDSPFGADRPTAQSLTERLFEDMALETGDLIELRGFRAPNEPVRTDYLDFIWSGDLPV